MKLARQMRKNPNMVGKPVPPVGTSYTPDAWRTGDDILGDKLRKLRHSNALDGATVAKELGVVKQILYAVERGEQLPSLSTLIRLAAFYEVTLDRLCGHMVVATRDE